MAAGRTATAGRRAGTARGLVAGLLLVAAAPVGAAEPGDGGSVASGRRVSLEYTVTLEDGTSVDSNVGREPMVYEHGAGELFPALEQALTGLSVDDRARITLSPDQAYGPVDPEAFRAVPSERIPSEARRVGAVLLAKDAEGNPHPVRVHDLGEDEVVLDFNHPLAGKVLIFEVRVVGIE